MLLRGASRAVRCQRLSSMPMAGHVFTFRRRQSFSFEWPPRLALHWTIPFLNFPLVGMIEATNF